MTLRIVLVDDHRMFREALRIPLAAEPDIDIIGEAGNGAELFAILDREVPNVLVLDIALPDMNGVDIARLALKKHPGLHIVALSGYADRMFVEEMLKAGAQGYVVKSAGAAELLRAIRAVAAGHIFLCPEITGCMVGKPATSESSPPPLNILGRREQDVLRLLAKGQRSIEIAAELAISPATVDVHRRNIKKKLGISSIADLTRYAIREGLQSL
jgi:two-component system NarL family response regulator